MLTSRVIWIVMYTGPEWNIPVEARADKRLAEACASLYNKVKDEGRLDHKRFYDQSLSQFTVEQINILEQK